VPAPTSAASFHDGATIAHVAELQVDHCMRIIGIIIGLAVATIGGVIAYRAFYLDPRSAVVITNSSIREVPNTLRVASGMVLVVLGAAIAFFSARRKS
jgi:hypothetical protein